MPHLLTAWFFFIVLLMYLSGAFQSDCEAD